MTIQISMLVLLGMLAVPVSWLLPRSIALDVVAIYSLVVLAYFSPATAAWLVAATLLTLTAMRVGEWWGHRGLWASIVAIKLLAGFVLSEVSQGYLWIGVSFFTLRLLHVLGEWWMIRMPLLTLRDLARYQFFLPVMIVGPIHRLPNFLRQVERRRFDWSDFLSGMERCLTGTFMAYVVGQVILARLDASRLAYFGLGEGFAIAWLLSAIAWIKLYFIFAGLSAVALGTGRMMGIRLEENFNKPWRADSLADFWSRWHMSLTSWSRDYVFMPVIAITRSPVLGVFSAMLVIGLWHAFSAYYVLWSFWQALGILLSLQAAKLGSLGRLPPWLRRIAVFASILGWLSLAQPVITLVLGASYDAAFALF